MSWGTELWDQFDRVTDHTNRGIEFVEKYSHFVKDRSKIEQDYANALRRLTKNYSPKKKEEESPFTVVKSFHDSLKEVNDIAGQHDLLAEQLQASIVKEMSSLVSELKSERKKHMDEAKKLEAQLQSQMRTLDASKRKYDKAYQDQVRAEDTYRIADANLNLSRAEVEKTRTVSHQKAQFCSDCKAGYAQVLEQTNTHQRDYYNKHLPQVFQAMQEMDEKRIVQLQTCLKQMSDIEKSIQPIINTCLEGITQASEKVDQSEDSRRVIDRFKSGFFPPDDIAFEDLGNDDNKSINSNNKVSRAETLKGNGTKANREKKRGGLKGIFGSRASEPEREDFGHLAPQQQKKQLKEKIKSIKHSINKENAEREAIVKMQDVYKDNPKLGDANALNGQLVENKSKLEALEAELCKYEGYLSGAENGGTPVMNRRSSVGSYQSTHSADVSVTPSTPGSAVNGTPAQSTPSNLSVTHQATPTRQTSTAMADSFDNDSFDEADADVVEPLPIIGHATALYQFDATTAGSLSMTSQEALSIVEQDNGDGWTRIRKPNGEEGFVPTTYIQIH